VCGDCNGGMGEAAAILMEGMVRALGGSSNGGGASGPSDPIEYPPHPSHHQPAWGDLSASSIYGIGTYDSLQGRKPKNQGLHVHHPIEKRFARLFGVRTGAMLSIVLTSTEHCRFTAA